MAVPMPVMRREKRRDKPSNFKSTFTPIVGTQSICCNNIFPDEIRGTCAMKYMNSAAGRIGSNILHFFLNLWPLNMMEDDKSNPDNTVVSI